MQWLIDLIIEAIGIPPVFIDRGGVVIPDFDVGDFIIDNGWHDIDLSGIVPAGAQGVVCSLGIETDGVEDCAHFRKKGATGFQNRSWVNTQVANSLFSCDITFGIDSDRKAEYRFLVAAWAQIFLTVKAWWL